MVKQLLQVMRERESFATMHEDGLDRFLGGLLGVEA
jgi:hypothetical protein